MQRQFSLVIDTAFEDCQIGLWQNDTCLATQTRPGGGKHDVVLAPMVAELFAAGRVGMRDIDKIIVTTGPGRFTGLRVGIAFARGLALVHGTPLVPVLTTHALRHEAVQAGVTDNAAVVVAVKRGESFVRDIGPAATTLRQVMDVDFVAAFPGDRVTTLAGVLSPELQWIIPQHAHLRFDTRIGAPSIAAIHAVGHILPVRENAVIRPYYAIE